MQAERRGVEVVAAAVVAGLLVLAKALAMWALVLVLALVVLLGWLLLVLVGVSLQSHQVALPLHLMPPHKRSAVQEGRKRHHPQLASHRLARVR